MAGPVGTASRRRPSATLRRLLGAPSSVKAWVDHLIAVGLSFDPETRAPLLGGREFVVLVSRGGATPKAHPDTGGTTLNHAFRTPSRSPARNRASSRRAHPRPHRPGHGRTDSTGRAESRRGRARHRRSVDPGTRTGIRHPRGGTATEVTPTPHTVSDAALALRPGHGMARTTARARRRRTAHPLRDAATASRSGTLAGARAGNSAGAGQNLPFILQEPWTGLVTGPARGHIASAQPPTPRPVEATHLTKQTTAPPGSRWLACSVMSCRAAFGSPAVARPARPRQPVYARSVGEAEPSHLSSSVRPLGGATR
jgi:hypothetical protein